MDDDLGFDGDNLADDPDDLLLFEQEGPGLFDEPLPEAEPACDIAATNQDLPEEPVAPPAPQAKVVERPPAPLALYRRYRPDTFAEVIGQEHVTAPLCRAIANNKVNHAYLFSGPRGCGKTTSARILARCLNCEQGPTPTPCGVCDSCVQLATGGSGSIDVIEIDAASHGRVDDARELRDGVYFAPVASRFKIYIIDEAHMVTKEGFNALLKVVEEPPEHVKFIFATTEPEKVIGTIRSRTHHYPFRLVPPRTLTAYLEKICAEEGVDVERGVLPLVVRAGAGSVRDSLSVLDQLLGAADHGRVSYSQAAGLLGYTPDALLDEIVDAFAAGDGKGVFSAIDKVIEVGQDPRRFAEDLLERTRDLVIVAQVPDAITSGLIDVADDQAERLRAQAAALGAGELTRAAEVIATGLVQMRGTTAPRLHLELICARVLLPTADDDSRGVHARLDRLERRLDMPDVVPGRPVASAVEPEPRQFSEVTDLASRRPASADAPTGSPGKQQEPPQQRPAVQRPAPVQRPVGQRPADHSPQEADLSPGAQQPATQAPPDPATQTSSDPATQASSDPSARPAPTPAKAPAASGPGTADLRRLWPQILDEVKSRKRFTHALLSQNAQVVEVRGNELLLGFANPGTLERFQSGGSIDVLRECLISVLGADLRISAAVDGGPSADTRHQPAAPQQPGNVPEPDPRPAPGHFQAVHADDRPPTEPDADESRRDVPGRNFDVPEPAMDDIVTAEDVVLDESGVDAAELLMRELGAQIIDEEEN